MSGDYSGAATSIQYSVTPTDFSNVKAGDLYTCTQTSTKTASGIKIKVQSVNSSSLMLKVDTNNDGMYNQDQTLSSTP